MLLKLSLPLEENSRTSTSTETIALAVHGRQPGTSKVVEGMTFYPPLDYDDDSEPLWNFCQSVRTRRPSAGDATFGSHTAIACHRANYSCFTKTVAGWDAGARKSKS